MTLNETLRTTTSVVFSRSISRDALYINGEEQDPFTNEEIPTYIRKVLNIMRDMAGIDAKALVVSENSFPADVGLASSDSGAAALVVGLNELFETNFPKDMLAELETEYLRVLHAPYMAV
jgi:diphosphomevalonate decarboxylase